MLVFPAAGNPAGTLKPINHAVDGRAGPFRRLHDRPAVQLRAVAERLEQHLKDVEQWASDPYWSCHELILPRSDNSGIPAAPLPGSDPDQDTERGGRRLDVYADPAPLQCPPEGGSEPLLGGPRWTPSASGIRHDRSVRRGSRWLRPLGLVAVVTVLTAVPTALAAASLNWPDWVVPVVAGAAGVLVATVKPLLDAYVQAWARRPQARAERQQHREELIEATRGDRRRLPRVVDCDPFLLGVHQAIAPPTKPQTRSATGDDEVPTPLPSYVERDADGHLRARLHDMRASGGFVLLLGESCTGKTRTAYEAIRTVLPDWSLMHPDDAATLAALATAGVPLGRTVIWLNETQRYLVESDGLTAGVIRRLLQAEHPPVLVGTIWPAYYQQLTRSPEVRDDGHLDDPNHSAREILGLAQVVHLTSFSRKERRRAEFLAESDARLAIALQSDDKGVTQVLAAGPDLIDRWRHAPDPYGRAIITAAIDAHRIRQAVPLSVDLLQAATLGYLTGPEVAAAPDGWFQRAVDYATELVKGAVAPLTATATTVGSVDGYLLADYLRQEGEAIRQHEWIPDQLWQACLDNRAAPEALRRLAFDARSRGRFRFAEDAYRQAASDGQTHHLSDLAEMFEEQGRLQEAEQLYREIVRSNAAFALDRLVALLERQGRADDAEQLYRDALEDGHHQRSSILHDLGRLLLRQQRLSEAAEILRSFGGESRSLAHLAEDQGRLDEAERIYRRMIDVPRGAYVNPDTYSVLARLLMKQGRVDDAERVYRQAAERDPERTSSRLAEFLEGQGRLDEAEQVLRQAAQAGYRFVSGDLADFLARRGRVDEAEQLYRQVGSLKEPETLDGLAELLERQERFDEAEEVYREALDYSWIALTNLIGLLERQGRVDEAEEVCRQAISRGNDLAFEELLSLLDRHGRVKEARHLRRHGFDTPARRGSSDGTSEFARG